MKHKKFLKEVIDILTGLIYFFAILISLAITGNLATRTGLLKDFIQKHPLSIDINGIQIFPSSPQPIWTILLPIVSSLCILFLLVILRRFLRNLYQDIIFSPINVILTQQTWKLLILLSFFSGTLKIDGNPILLPFSFSFSLNIWLMLAALIVWSLAKILERGIEIAEENELTI